MCRGWRIFSNNPALTEWKIWEIRELNRPAIDALDRIEIERRVKALEERDERDKEEVKRRLEIVESRTRLISYRLMWLLAGLFIAVWIIGLILGVI